MSAKIKVLANAPAFPHTHGVRSMPGLTKREYIAAAILGAIMPGDEAGFPPSVACRVAIDYADELIRELDATSAEES